MSVFFLLFQTIPIIAVRVSKCRSVRVSNLLSWAALDQHSCFFSLLRRWNSLNLFVVCLIQLDSLDGNRKGILRKIVEEGEIVAEVLPSFHVYQLSRPRMLPKLRAWVLSRINPLSLKQQNTQILDCISQSDIVRRSESKLMPTLTIGTWLRANFFIVRQQTFHQTYAYLSIGDVECI